MKVRVILIFLLLFPISQVVDAGKKQSDEREDVYNALRLGDLGLPLEAYKMAIHGLDKLIEKGTLTNSSILTIIDFSQSSNNKRMYSIS